MPNFVHLHLHSEYSLLDGAVRLKSLVEKAKEYGMPAVAITDHGVMYGAIKFYRLAINAGIKPIIGCEVYVAPRRRFDKEARVDEKSFHLTLLAENNQGYQNLLALVSKASLEGFYYRPRVDLDLLSQHSKGLIALSGCLSGQIASLLSQDQLEQAEKKLDEYINIFGKNNFYIEIQNHGLKRQLDLIPHLVRLARNKGVPLVATNDVHFLDHNDAKIQDILLCVQTGKTFSDPDRLRFDSDEMYFKTAEEMAELFPELPDALNNTLEIAERCNVTIDFDHFHLPHFEVQGDKSFEDKSLEEYLKELCLKGINKRYGQMTDEVTERLFYELSTLEKMGFTSYFLIVHDFIDYARRNGIPVGPGRGSAAGSLIAYLLEITDVDPLKYGLLFERFLNSERVTMPDIDIDFCYVRRDEVINYVTEKYGEDHVAQIITFGTMAARAVIRDVGRVLEMPLSKVDKIAKLIPGGSGITIDKAIKRSPDLKKILLEDEEAKKLIEIGRKLEGLPRHASTHAAGVVISKDPLEKYTPIQRNKEDITTQYEMEDLENIGLLKMDFLGLRTLTVINDTVDVLKKRGIEIDIRKLSLDDPKPFQLLREVKTAGIFQMESRLYQRLCKDLQPENFDDIVAMMALGRPGALQSGMVEDYFACRHGKKKIEYLHPVLEPILKETYGLILYQEQVMIIACQLANYTLGEADILRRGMGKKKEELIRQHRERFLEGAKQNKIPLDIANRIFDLMEYFGGYGFNKSHSVAYALIAYQTTFLKAYYPVEFMAATLTSVMGSSGKVAYYIDECHQMGIEVLPPDVNQSGMHFTVVDKNKIRFGLAAIKNVGTNAIAVLVKGREKEQYHSLTDLCQRVDTGRVNSRGLESLIRCGALDSLGGNRSQYLAVLDYVVQRAQSAHKQKVKGQISLVENLAGYEERSQIKDILPELPEYSAAELLKMEKELLGFYLTGHPLDPFLTRYNHWVQDKVGQLVELEDRSQVVLGGVITDRKIHTTKKNQLMAFISVEDWSGSVDGVVFPRVYERYKDLIQVDQPILIIGKLDQKDDGISLLIDQILPLNQEFLVIRLNIQEYNLQLLKKLGQGLQKYSGLLPVICELVIGGKMLTFITDKEFWISKEEIVVEFLEKVIGNNNFYFS
ncbi:MAG: DNA polymerase III subunit alpha [Halanaerobiales bacterium]|nr:DNA polymerase III subunit alpha [Halanaerobiales bacterium]